MQKAYFNNIRKQIIESLHNAKRYVHIAMAWFTSLELLNALIDCKNRGVEVQLILLDDPINWSPVAPDFNKLIDQGCKMLIADETVGFMHHKFCIIDGNLLLSGSYNWTNYAESRNLENIVISDDQELIESFEVEFVRIKDKLNEIKCAPRLTWEDIELCDNVDFELFNYEVAKVSKELNVPSRKVIHASTKVQVIDKARKPMSNYEIGLSLSPNPEDWITIIKERTSLPSIDQEVKDELFIEGSKAKIAKIKISIYKDGFAEPCSIKDITLGDIATSSAKNTPILISLSLHENGYLHGKITAKDSNKYIDFALTQPNLVTYED